MAIFSNDVFFPILQLALLGLLILALLRDRPWAMTENIANPGVSTTKTTLQMATGLVVAAIVMIVNKSVFDDAGSDWRHYSAFINLFDLCAVAYLFYLSPAGRVYLMQFERR